jgi:hypothetical protein
MAIVKRVLCFFYAVQTLFFCAVLFFLLSPNARIQQLLARSSRVGIAIAVVLAVAMAVPFAGAWFTVRKGHPSARFWVILPSLFFLIAAAGGLLAPLMPHRAHAHANPLLGLFLLALAIAGPLVTWRKQSRAVSTAAPAIPKIKGDGTNDLLNKAGYVFSIVSYLGSLMLWDAWLRSQGLPPMRRGIVAVIATSLVATFFHELGHALIGTAFHMKLRAFVVGPFQFRIVEGRWMFNFNAAGFLSMGGVTGLVPSSASQPPLQELAMIAAGPLTNLYMGLLAGGLAIACTSDPTAYLGYMYPLALFAIINLVDCFTNLIPLRTATGYSDGAQIYQILGGGSWAAYHRAMGVVSSSLVTPLRPRDYDMNVLELAAQGISEGVIGLRLRLFRYQHLLDCGNLAGAGEALKEADAMHEASPPKEIGALHTVFVFGYAYVLHDAAAARRWWDRMAASKRKLLNVDYWRSASALHWIEGDLAQANEDWTKANAKAEKLPFAGAYEFDRSCCKLLRRVLDGDMTPPEIVEPARKEFPVTPVIYPAATAPAPRVAAEEEYEYSFMRGLPRDPAGNSEQST